MFAQKFRQIRLGQDRTVDWPLDPASGKSWGVTEGKFFINGIFDARVIFDVWVAKWGVAVAKLVAVMYTVFGRLRLKGVVVPVQLVDKLPFNTTVALKMTPQ